MMLTHFYRNIYLKFCVTIWEGEESGEIQFTPFFFLVLFVLLSTLSSLFLSVYILVVGVTPWETTIKTLKEKKKESESMPIVGILDENNVKHKLIQFSSCI